MRETFHIEIDMPQKMSEVSKKTNDTYFQMKCQLRFLYFDKKIKMVKNNEIFLDDINFQNFKAKALDEFNEMRDEINKIEEDKNGFNLYFRSYRAITKIMKLFDKYFIETIHTKKLFGFDNLKSKKIYRHTYLINILNIKQNQILNIKGEDKLVFRIQKNEIILKDIKSGAKTKTKFKFIKEYLRF